MYQRWKVFTVLVALGLVLAACGPGTSPSASAGASEAASVAPQAITIVHGTTDQPTSYDPAGSYDLPSWNVLWNVMQTLLTFAPGGDTPVPQLAEACQFDDETTFSCTLPSGVTFQDGSALDAEDVKFSFDRNIAIADPNGASSLLGSLDSVEVVDPLTVTFHLKAPDATFPSVLTAASNSIVPSDVYPADALEPNTTMIGTGPYKMTDFQPGVQTVLERFDGFRGDAPANDRVIIQYFESSATLKLALENGEVDVAFRSLTPTELADLRTKDGIEVVDGAGAEIRYMVFNLSFEPGDQVAVRKAVAYTIDRQSIAENVYDGTVQPLWSMDPAGMAGHLDSFKDLYGDAPDLDAATQVLEDASISTPVDLEVWWTPTHYGDTSADEYIEIKRQLDESGLFNVTLMSTEWEEYKTGAFGDGYPVYQLGWFPDFVDPDNYLASFYAQSSFLNIHYVNDEVESLIAQERASSDQAERVRIFETIQGLVAEEVPIIPIWQGKQVGAVRTGVTGVADTFDPAFIFRYWLISK